MDKRLDPVPTRQLLHAWKLKLRHPLTRAPLELVAPVPEDMVDYVEGFESVRGLS